jgi:glycyl-tRNA synthetase alpha chain
MSHTFNVLDARGAVSTTERPGIIKRVRDLACGCAKAFLDFETAKNETADIADKTAKVEGGAK